jgi:hypothetical protein
MIHYKQFPFRELQGKLPCSQKPSRNSWHESNTSNPICIMYNAYDINWMIWYSNLDRSYRTISSQKHPEQLQRPTCLQLNENQSFFSGSKVARAVSQATHFCLAQSLKKEWSYTSTKPVCLHGTQWDNCIFLNLLPMHISFKRSHPFRSYKGTFLYITLLYLSMVLIGLSWLTVKR